MMMEKEEKSDRGRSLMMMKPPPPPSETAEFVLQWGSRKRMRCMRIRGNTGGGATTTTTTSTSPPHRLSSSPSPDPIPPSSNSSGRLRRKVTSRFPTAASIDQKHLSFAHPTSRHTRNSEAAAGTVRSDSRKTSPEKPYTTRGSGAAAEDSGCLDEQPNHLHHLHNQNDINLKNGNFHGSRGSNLVLPKLFIALSSKEKEEDFLAMKGCKLPQRPKKRAKLIQRTILLVSPGAWLPEMSLERYEVREKKASKKQRPRGLKAMGNLDSDSE